MYLLLPVGLHERESVAFMSATGHIVTRARSRNVTFKALVRLGLIFFFNSVSLSGLTTCDLSLHNVFLCCQ